MISGDDIWKYISENRYGESHDNLKVCSKEDLLVLAKSQFKRRLRVRVYDKGKVRAKLIDMDLLSEYFTCSNCGLKIHYKELGILTCPRCKADIVGIDMIYEDNDD